MYSEIHSEIYSEMRIKINREIYSKWWGEMCSEMNSKMSSKMHSAILINQLTEKKRKKHYSLVGKKRKTTMPRPPITIAG